MSIRIIGSKILYRAECESAGGTEDGDCADGSNNTFYWHSLIDEYFKFFEKLFFLKLFLL